MADSTKKETFVVGFSGGLGVRIYTNPYAGNMRGFYLGAACEYAYTKTRDDTDDMAEYSTYSMMPMGELGYRWVWGNFLLSVGGALGAGIPVSHEDTPIGENGCKYGNDSCPNERSVYPFGGISLDLGWFL